MWHGGFVNPFVENKIIPRCCIEVMKFFKGILKPKNWNWWIIVTVFLFVFILVNRINVIDTPAPILEGAVGNQSSTSVTGTNPLGNTYTMVNTVTEPDGTIVTDTLDTDGNYVTTVYNSSTLNMNQATATPAQTTQTTPPGSVFTEIRQQRNIFSE
jgi:hypothetical protein